MCVHDTAATSACQYRSSPLWAITTDTLPGNPDTGHATRARIDETSTHTVGWAAAMASTGPEVSPSSLSGLWSLRIAGCVVSSHDSLSL